MITDDNFSDDCVSRNIVDTFRGDRDRESGRCAGNCSPAFPEFEYFEEIGGRGFSINLIFKWHIFKNLIWIRAENSANTTRNSAATPWRSFATIICWLPTKVSSLIHISLTFLLVSFNSFRPSVGETNTTATTLHNSVEIKCWIKYRF